MQEYQTSKQDLTQESTAKTRKGIPQEAFVKSRHLEEPLEELLKRGEIQTLRGLSILEGYSFDGFIVHMIREFIKVHYLDDNGADLALRWRLRSEE